MSQRYYLVKFFVDEEGNPYLAPQKVIGGGYIFQNKKKDDGSIFVKDRHGSTFGFKPYQIQKVLEILCGKYSCDDVRRDYIRIKSKKKFNRFVYEVTKSIINKLTKFKYWLNS